MKSGKHGARRSVSVLKKIGLMIERNRLGELLVFSGLLTPQELRYALAFQRHDNQALGRILVARRMISRRMLYSVLIQQWTLRCLAWLTAFMIAFGACGGIRDARADSHKIQISMTQTANSAFAPVRSFPALFGSDEKISTNLEPFTKWTGMFRRYEQAMSNPSSRKTMDRWQSRLQGMQGLSLNAMADRVNDLVNEQEYIIDNRNWGKSDYWETPIEFFGRGGDCEDFAIAKYESLRALGVPEERLRIAIVHDMKKDTPHAVLVVYTDTDALILDNQIKDVRSSRNITHYRPIFTINRTAWWLHTRPAATVVASR